MIPVGSTGSAREIMLLDYISGVQQGDQPEKKGAVPCREGTITC
jgi:hypothetical protein